MANDLSKRRSWVHGVIQQIYPDGRVDFLVPGRSHPYGKVSVIGSRSQGLIQGGTGLLALHYSSNYLPELIGPSPWQVGPGVLGPSEKPLPIEPLEWPVYGHDLAGTFDTGDRSQPGWSLPGAEATPFERQSEWNHCTSSRIAKNRIIWLRNNGSQYAWHFWHVRLGKTEDDDRKDDPGFLDSDTGNLDEWVINLDDAPDWCSPVAEPNGAAPNHFVLMEVPEGEMQPDVLYAVTTFINSNVVG